MKFKDILGISLVSLALFPILLIGMLMATGLVRLEFGKKNDDLRTSYFRRYDPKQDEAEARQMKAFQALEERERKLRESELDLNRQIERLENLKLETAKAKEAIEADRRRIEELVSRSGELQDKRLAALAQVYGGMRSEEAAPVLLTLDDSMVVAIMRKIPETRSSSKILAAMAALDVKRAARITELLGADDAKRPWRQGAKKAAPGAARNPPQPALPATNPAAPAPDTRTPAGET